MVLKLGMVADDVPAMISLGIISGERLLLPLPTLLLPIGIMSVALTLASVVVVFSASLAMSAGVEAIGFGGAGVGRHARADGAAEPDLRLQIAQALLAAVVSVGRSPSSAIAVVSELRSEGAFTQTVLSVTMVTDVLVILLFAATYANPYPNYHSDGAPSSSLSPSPSRSGRSSSSPRTPTAALAVGASHAH